jgi:hypothetical protein
MNGEVVLTTAEAVVMNAEIKVNRTVIDSTTIN